MLGFTPPRARGGNTSKVCSGSARPVSVHVSSGASRDGARDRHIHRARAIAQSPALRDAETRKVLSTEYDPEELEAFFAERPALFVLRLLQVARRLTSLYVSQAVRRNMGTVSSAAQDELEARELCSALSSLGPTFVKLGQTLATREDLIGRRYSRALSNLQMSAPPFDDAEALRVIEAELRGDPRTLFREFREQHIAAASLGQVYRGKLHETGEAAAVKVQRPDMLGSIALDVYLLRKALGLVRRVAKINADIRNIADEVGKGLFAELDYRVEAEQARVFAEAHSHLPYIQAVQVVPELSTSRVLTTRWVDGASPTDLLAACERAAPGSEEQHQLRARLVAMVNMGVECSLSQLLETGIMHADPHPGNLIVMRDGRLAYLDFGLLTFVPPQSSQAMMACLVHVALGEWRSMADDLDRMGMLKERTDKDDLARSLAEEVSAVWPLAGSFGADSFLPDGSAKAGGALADRIASGAVNPELGLGQGLSFGKLAKAIIKLAIKYRFHLPPYYTLIVRSLCTLEGLALRVDPSFSIVNAAIPILLRRMLTDPRKSSVALLRELLLDDGNRLRVGMLEGLLRNYSAEVGKSMTASPASGVVLKNVDRGGAGGARAPYAVANGTAAASMAPPVSTWREGQSEVVQRSDGAGGRGRNGAAVGAGADVDDVADAVAEELGERGSSGAAAMLTTAETAQLAAHRAADAAGAQAAAGHAAAGAQAEAAAVDDVGAVPHQDDSEAAGGPADAAASASFQAQVLTMVLSAKAAGVRRVLLEADMKDIVSQVSGPDGSELRERIAKQLAEVVSWELILKTVRMALARAAIFVAVQLHKLVTLGRASRRVKTGAKGATVLGVSLGPVPIKRATLMARAGFAKLWRQSWTTAIASLWLGLTIVRRALLIRKESVQAQPAN